MDDFSIKPGVPNIYGLIGGINNSIYPEKRMLSSMTPTIIEKNNDLEARVAPHDSDDFIGNESDEFIKSCGSKGATSIKAPVKDPSLVCLIWVGLFKSRHPDPGTCGRVVPSHSP